MPENNSNLTPRAKRALILAKEEAERLNCDCVGTEHLLLGLLSLNEGVAVDAAVLTQTNALKTSALLEAACQMGAVIGGATEEQIHYAGIYAYELGLAFQVVDDILDVTGNAEELGKPIGSDAENGKTTFVSLLTLEGAEKLAKECTDRALAALDKLPESAFLIELTNDLLARRQ